MRMDKAIIVDHLSYTNEVKDVSFTIQSGEMVGIIGPAGSGKSAILKILAGLLKPTSGFVSVLGHDPFLKTDDYLKLIAYIGQDKRQFLSSLAPIKILEITRDIYDMNSREFNKNLSELTQYINDPVLIYNLIYKPKIILIDKPGSERESIYEYNSKNTSTTLLTSEKIDNLTSLVRRVILVDKGAVLYDGAIDEIITKYAKEKIINATLSSPINVDSVSEIATVKNYLFPHLRVSCPRDVASLTASELMQNLPVTNINIQEMSVEEIIGNMKP